MSRAVARRFSAAAGTYDSHVGVQEEAAARLMEWIADEPGAAGPGPILEIGCGTGLLTRRLLRRWPGRAVWATDVAERMVERTRAALAGAPNLRCFCADGRHPPLRVTVPLAVSSSALHWIVPIRDAFAGVVSVLRPGGLLAAAIMTEGTLAELRAVRQAVAPDNPPAGRMPDRAEIAAGLAAAGLAVVREEALALREVHPSAGVFLRRIHEQGLTGGAVSRGRRPLTRGELRGIEVEYARRYPSAGGGVSACYRVVLVLARREGGGEEGGRS